MGNAVSNEPHVIEITRDSGERSDKGHAVAEKQLRSRHHGVPF